jgi:NAD-dependent SIR2 family protein deacetylase
MTYTPDQNLNPPEETVFGYDYWYCAGCGKKFTREEIFRVRMIEKNGNAGDDSNKCEYCIREEIAEWLENEDHIIISKGLDEPDGFEEMDEATANGY